MPTFTVYDITCDGKTVDVSWTTSLKNRLLGYAIHIYNARLRRHDEESDDTGEFTAQKLAEADVRYRVLETRRSAPSYDKVVRMLRHGDYNHVEGQSLRQVYTDYVAEIIASAKAYATFAAWRQHEPNNYVWAKTLGIVDECVRHMALKPAKTACQKAYARRYVYTTKPLVVDLNTVETLRCKKVRGKVHGNAHAQVTGA